MASAALLATTDIEEALSQAYVSALAAMAGYAIAMRNFDRDGVDLTVEAGGHMRPKLDMQLKATINLPEVGADKKHLSFHCPKRNYDLLRLPTQTPRILVVLHLPKEATDWLTVTPSELVMRNCAYWMSLRGSDEIAPGNQGKTVHLPKSNRLDVEALAALMDQSRSGAIG